MTSPIYRPAPGKKLQLGNCDGDQARRQDRAGQEARRAEMYDTLEKALAANADDVVARVKSRKAAVERQGDPMALTGRKRDRRAHEAQVTALHRGDTLARLTNSGTLDERQLRAGRRIADLVLACTGGMAAMDLTRERVDGGKGPSDQLIGGGSYGAERTLKTMIRETGMGHAAATIVLRIAGAGESVTAMALEFEVDPKGGQNGGSSSRAREWVTRLLAHGLKLAADYWWPENHGANHVGSRAHISFSAMRAWLADDAKTSLDQTVFGERPDLVRRRA